MSLITLPSGQIVYDPTGVVETTERSLAPRVDSLAGLRLGVLDNSKWNAGKLLRSTVELLEEGDGFASVSFLRKHSFSSNADPDLITQLVAESDAVVTAVGD